MIERTARRAVHRTVRTALLAALLALAATVGLTAAAFAAPAVQRHAGMHSDGIYPGSPEGYAEHMWYHPGGMRFVGWAFDPTTPKTALTVYVVVDGVKIGQVTADDPRPDVAKAHHSAGANHGFDTFMRINQGRHTICVWARDIGKGYDLQMRCVRRTLDYGPVGKATVSRLPGALRVHGWAYDLDAPTEPVTVVVGVDGHRTPVVATRHNANAVKYDSTVGARVGANHGFSLTIPVAQGTHSVSVVGTDIGFGTDNVLLTRSVVLDESPRGLVDPLAQHGGKLRVRGWAYDPDEPKTPLAVTITIDGTGHSLTADAARSDLAKAHPTVGAEHGFDRTYTLAEGTHRICVLAKNLSYGSDTTITCQNLTVDFTPTARVTSLTPTSTGMTVAGWATDPDTSAPISVRLGVDGHHVKTVVANRKADAYSGHAFALTLPSTSGTHTVCAIGMNVEYGTHNSHKSCKTITLALDPIGRFESVKRAPGSTNLAITGWAFDPDTTSPTAVAITVDGVAAGSPTTSEPRSDVAKAYPSAGKLPGLSTTVTADDGEHTVCLTARNASGGSDTSLGCKVIIAVHPVAPSPPRKVTATASYGAAIVTWQAPASDGGAPWTSYVVTASPGGKSVTATATATSVVVSGLKTKTHYTFTVQAVNVAGASVGVASPDIKTLAGPPPQTTPAPVSTSRYIRNVRGSSASELATMRREGAADANANPSGHAYLILLDIGGQDDADGGVVLSATTHFVSYGDLVRDVDAYVDGYHSKQRAGAPVTIAIGTNNDMEVSRTSGAGWANHVVDRVLAHAKVYGAMTIAGANDIEPGFRASYSASKSWLQGYLGATKAQFVFNGSADGCAWTIANGHCNNGWTMSGLYYLAAGAAPTRMINLPQVYNTTMSAQWKYISLTGIGHGQPRINFGGVLTEWTACEQSSCGSMTGRSAWTTMWRNLQSDARLKVGSLPYSTDLRIDS